ncbi:MAG: FMN-binding glutamate synthase family protein [Thiothrix sp.]|uniref:FMN-binding glutamate synthase family protein n=1 Tax=Thiothrix sp. TaxID=1032 RepID=UPI002625198B|nr:FMN-binding glutamate synthase family protein [Thiothrix sp.]MDD5392120.1 FMN-binding glutamate synthase family protein [Thiothrix sp.]
MDSSIFLTLLEFLAALFIVVIGAAILLGIGVYLHDINQTKSAILRNYPVIGHFRYWLEHLGEFLRQYFFAMDREEMPFNRAQRSWVYRAAKNLDNTVAFGSTINLSTPGTTLFVNCAYPVLDTDIAETQPRRIGQYCREPYDAPSFFNISAMSYGALSGPAIRALSRGAAQAGCWLNTGEGGLADAHLDGGCDVVFQIGTAKYGVRDLEGKLSDAKLREVAAIPQIKMFELKLSQGAKPGKGGILPAEKVSEEIARIRGIPVHQASISPNRHPEVNDEQDLLDMLNHIREVTGKPVGFKAVIGGYRWLEKLFHEINRRGIESAPDFITLDSADGGTGAAPMSLMDYVGLPIQETLPNVVDMLYKFGLRERIRIIAAGKLLNPSQVAWALCAGADFINNGRGFMFALGCIQAMQCNKNTCPTGITTHDPRLQKGLVVEDKATRVAHYHHNLVHEVSTVAHSCGVNEPRDLRRQHCRIVQPDGRIVPLDHLYPYPERNGKPDAATR